MCPLGGDGVEWRRERRIRGPDDPHRPPPICIQGPGKVAFAHSFSTVCRISNLGLESRNMHEASPCSIFALVEPAKDRGKSCNWACMESREHGLYQIDERLRLYAGPSRNTLIWRAWKGTIPLGRRATWT